MNSVLAVVAALALLGVVAASPAKVKEEPPTPGPMTPKPPCTDPWCNLRIPQDIYRPVKYDLTLEPDLEPADDNLFNGTVIATVEVLKPTSVFMIHIKELTVTSTKLSGGHEVKRTFPYEENQFWVIETTKNVPKGTFDLTLEFSGYLTHGIVGFYKSTYKDDSGKVHALATSKFEPSDARKAFPCFDEPNLKATYVVSLVYKKTVGENHGYYALSNMPTDSEPQVLANGKYKQKFKESVPMSTYLACFIVCDFDMKSKDTKSGVKFSVYSPKGTLNQAEYALETGVTIIEFYEKFFQIPYPLPKQDMIAIPDFPSGAMEHWGLITYRMTAMLYDANMASLSEKQRVTTVIAHELAHMWFGNLVTMDWWDDLWLNEGFASFIEYFGTDKAEPDYKVFDQFLSMDMKGVMKLDSTDASHPIITKVDSPNQITELFDSITYSKGCSVIRMLESYLGETDFRNGVTSYLMRHKFGNAKNSDLWKALSANSSAGIDVGALMDSWTKQSHYPLVVVEEVKADGSDTKVTVRQETFLLDDNAEGDGTMWRIPIMAIGSENVPPIATAGSTTTYLLTTKKGSFTFPGGVATYLKLNAGQNGFYRVLYTGDEWEKLTALLNSNHVSLSAVDRAGLLDDAFNLARAGKTTYKEAFKALEYLDKEKAYIPWNIAASALTYITDNYGGAFAGKWRQFIAEKAGSVLKEIEFQEKVDDTFTTKRLRPTLIALACRHGDDQCLKDTKVAFNEWLNKDGYKLPVNVRQQVYQYGMKFAGWDEWVKVHDIYKNTTVPQERKKLRAAMAMPSDPWILNRYIEYAENEDQGFKSQDYFSIMEYIANNPIGLPLVWTYIKNHWENLVDRFTINDRYFGRMINRVISNFNDEFHLDEVNKFFADNPEAGAGKRARQEGLTNIQNNIDWKKKKEGQLDDWLKNL